MKSDLGCVETIEGLPGSTCGGLFSISALLASLFGNRNCHFF